MSLYVILLIIIFCIISMFFIDSRLFAMDLLIIFITMFMIEANKNFSNKIIPYCIYLAFLAISFLVAQSYKKVDAIENRHFGKLSWLVAIAIYMYFIWGIININNLSSLTGRDVLLSLYLILVSYIIVVALDYILFIYILFPITMICGKRETWKLAEIESLYVKRLPYKHKNIYVVIKNYSNGEFSCSSKAIDKVLKRKSKYTRTIDVIRVPLTNRVIIPEI